MSLDPKTTLRRISLKQDEREKALNDFDIALSKLALDASPENVKAVEAAEQKLKEIDAAYREGARLLLLAEMEKSKNSQDLPSV